MEDSRAIDVFRSSALRAAAGRLLAQRFTSWRRSADVRGVPRPPTRVASGPLRPSGCSGAPASAPRRRGGTRAKLGLDGAVHSLTHPQGREARGHRPTTSKGRPLAPADAWGHDHLWWLDRMVRTSRPLVERMTLVWHDWFATSNDGVGSQRLMLEQNELFRRIALGSFATSCSRSRPTRRCCSGSPASTTARTRRTRTTARELMELFTLGAGRGYTERDVREQARALTGWTSTLEARARGRSTSASTAPPRRRREDRSSARAGTSTGATPCRSASTTRSTPSFFVDEAVELLRPDAARRAARSARSSALYVATDYQVRPVVEAILRAPGSSTPGRAWSSRRSSTPPGCCAALGRGSTRQPGSGSPSEPGSGSSTRRTSRAGTTSRWLDTATLPRPLGDRERRAREGRARAPGKKHAPKVAADAGGDRRGRARLLGATRRIRPRDEAALIGFAAAGA